MFSLVNQTHSLVLSPRVGVELESNSSLVSEYSCRQQYKWFDSNNYRFYDFNTLKGHLMWRGTNIVCQVSGMGEKSHVFIQSAVSQPMKGPTKAAGGAT